jgi:hypothetical protein
MDLRDGDEEVSQHRRQKEKEEEEEEGEGEDWKKCN